MKYLFLTPQPYSELLKKTTRQKQNSRHTDKQNYVFQLNGGMTNRAFFNQLSLTSTDISDYSVIFIEKSK